MNELARLEFAALRDTIRARAGARPWVALTGLAAWAGLLVTVLVALPNPIAAVVPLLVLVATFEAVRALHLGIERIGRYLQVFFEEGPGGEAVALDPPAWERVAMLFGPSLPGAGGHPLLLPVFLLAAVVNFTAVVLPGPLPVELGMLAVPHAAFLVWLLYCDRAMRGQRASDLARFRALKRGPGAGR